METLEHFLLDCVYLEEVRRRRGMQGVPVEEVLLFEVRDGRCIGDLRNYIGELLRRKQLMSCVHTGGGGFLEGTRWQRSKREQEERSEQWKKCRRN